ncbi:MAG: glycosyltransferase family 2 protein [Lachnospiraceae bacterium]|nr:glycosyltransferase family 2 protein [Lachnospiraceae bacterium]
MSKDISKAAGSLAAEGLAAEHLAAGSLAAEAPLVSVVIPVYNVRRYLQQCLESAIAQTYRNLEIIIIDDGSTDGSGSICDQYAERDGRIHVIHSTNRGLASARNLGLENAQGQLISFLDSDDWIEPHAVETLVRTAQLTGSAIIDARSCAEYIGKTVHHSAGAKYCYTYRGQDILPAFAEGWIDNVVWNKLYRAECFDRIRFPEGRDYEDIAVVWKLMKDQAGNGGSVTALSDELFHYRVRKSSLSHGWSLKSIRDGWIAYSSKFEAMPDFKEPLEECFRPIKRMWMSFSGYTKEEKAEARKTVREMHEFSKKHFSKVMKGNYSKLTKLTCLLSQSKSRPAMWIGYYANKLSQKVRGRENRMFE